MGWHAFTTLEWSFASCERDVQQDGCSLYDHSHSPPHRCMCRGPHPHSDSASQQCGCWSVSPCSRSRNAAWQRLRENTWRRQRRGWFETQNLGNCNWTVLSFNISIVCDFAWDKRCFYLKGLTRVQFCVTLQFSRASHDVPISCCHCVCGCHLLMCGLMISHNKKVIIKRKSIFAVTQQSLLTLLIVRLL